MEKLELKHLAPYLPYGLKAITTKETYKDPQVGIIDYWSKNGNVENEISISSDEGYYLCQPHEIKPLLRPLSDLYTLDKRNIAPIYDIACMIDNNYRKYVHPYTEDLEIKVFSNYVYICTKRSICSDVLPIEVYFEPGGCLLNIRVLDRNISTRTSLSVFTYLFQHHYDVWDLIGQNLAIDKSKIK